MSSLTIGSAVSQIRNIFKGNTQDSYLTDLEIYLMIKRHAAVLMKRLDEKGKLTKFSSVFETLDMVELCEVDRVEASECSWAPRSFQSMRKTKLPMPMFTEGVYGPMVRSVTSLDGSTVFKMIYNIDIYTLISRQPNFKYNKWKYCWYLNDHLYFVDIDAPAVRVEGIFEDDISAFKCCYDDRCKRRQDQSLNIPDFMINDIFEGVKKDMQLQLQVPSDPNPDGISPLKS
jgi:hypothetical protein